MGDAKAQIFELRSQILKPRILDPIGEAKAKIFEIRSQIVKSTNMTNKNIEKR